MRKSFRLWAVKFLPLIAKESLPLCVTWEVRAPFCNCKKNTVVSSDPHRCGTKHQWRCRQNMSGKVGSSRTGAMWRRRWRRLKVPLNWPLSVLQDCSIRKGSHQCEDYSSYGPREYISWPRAGKTVQANYSFFAGAYQRFLWTSTIRRRHQLQSGSILNKYLY